MRYKTCSWEQKIDPAFDKIIKITLELLDAVKLPANDGYIHIKKEDPLFQLIKSERFPDFRSCYENLNPDNVVGRCEELMGSVEGREKPLIFMKELWQDYAAVIRGIAERQWDVVDEVLLRLINSLDQKSKDYYMTVFVFDPIAKRQLMTKLITMSPEEQTERFIYQLSHVLSLFLHKVFIGFQVHRDVVKELTPEIMKTILFEVFNVISLIVYEKSLRSLYSEAKDGDNKSLFKILQIDKTLFDHEWVRELIREAMYSGDSIFFKSLAKAMRDDPLKNRKIRIREFIVLSVFWDAGLYRLSIAELINLFNDSGLAVIEDEVTFRKFVDRFKKIRPLFTSFSHLFQK